MRETGVDNVVRSLLAKLDILMTVAGSQSAGQTKKEGVICSGPRDFPFLPVASKPWKQERFEN